MCGGPTLAAQTFDLWRIEQEDILPQGTGNLIYKPDIFETIVSSIEGLSDKLRALSLDIHAHPELKYEEFRTHDVLTHFLENEGWEVTRHHHLQTAWVAKFHHGSGGRTIGVNSEMDALPGVGHACGHNLIAIAGVAVASALREVLKKYNINGSIVLLGTPAEEGGGGKVQLLDAGAYNEMDICLMCHPAPGPPHSGSLSASLALSRTEVQYYGHTAHAALSPWEGRNALDAAVSAYTNISLLRQQLKPTNRVHGIIEGKDWAPNIIPDYSKMVSYVRGLSRVDVEAAVPRVHACFEAAAKATGCEVNIREYDKILEIRQNKALGEEFADVFSSNFGPIDYVWGISSASTDFGNVTYALPSLHPGFGIPTVPNGGNHTRQFAESAKGIPAHKACLNVSKALAAVGARVLTDDEYFAKVVNTFEEDKMAREKAT
ncbi:aminoacylase 1-like protein 2 [Abortiporus biennis]|nr:aminoacylase 1-like protein 2 [Abortiporus biennis]